MMQFDNLGPFTQSGVFSYNIHYYKTFNKVPSEFYYKFDLDDDNDERYNKSIDINNITKEYLEEKFSKKYGIFNVRFVRCKSKKKTTSAVDDYDNEHEIEDNDSEYTRFGCYALDGYRNAFVYITFLNIKVVVVLDTTSLCVLYDANSDIIGDKDVEEFADDIFKKLPIINLSKDDDACVSLVSFSPNEGYYTIESKVNNTTIDIDKNYNDDFKPVYEDIKNFLTNKERKSGLILLNGEPGTGKSYFIRHLLTNFKNEYIIVIPSVSTRLAEPDFITFLIENKNTVFILEDCEQVIMSREINSFSSAISAILNMSDGLMSDIFNVKFICTFNSPLSAIDDAILRKGRCYANYEFKKLNKDKATKLLHELGKDVEATEDMSLAEIYNYGNLNEEDNNQKRNKIGF